MFWLETFYNFLAKPQFMSNASLHIVLVGSGGREHALARLIAESNLVDLLTLLPGVESESAIRGLVLSCSSRALQVPLTIKTRLGPLRPPFTSILRDIQSSRKIDLMIIGPEQPLADGLADEARSLGITVFGPGRDGARLEFSKVFAKEVMQSAHVKTARSITVQSVSALKKAIEPGGLASDFRTPYVLKADGLCAGKGVFIVDSKAELLEHARRLFDDQVLGEAGSTALLEEFTPGVEVSHLVLVSGKDYVTLPAARDHKRLKDCDEGPNTGGMGVVAPISLEGDLLHRIDREVVKPVLAELQRREIDFRGVLYFGLMLTADGPSVLEFNTRFGDPEAQALIPLFRSADAAIEKWIALAQGQSERNTIQYPASGTDLFDDQRFTAVLVLASEGYPENPVRGASISGLTAEGELKFIPTRASAGAQSEAAWCIHCGTEWSPEKGWITRGGRVLNIVAQSQISLDAAIRLAYQAAEHVTWPGRQMRLDIGRSH